MSLLEDSIRRLVECPKHDLLLYLDECGTPATDSRFITAGVLLYRDTQEVAANWEQFWGQAQLGRKKGRDLNEASLLDVSAFFITQPVLPVAGFSIMEPEQRDRLREFSKKFERSNSTAKRFRKISPASWLWKYQMNQTVALAEAAFLLSVGPIRTGTVFVDEVTEEKHKREHYRQLLTLYSKSERLGQAVDQIGTPESFRKLLLDSVPVEWQINLSAKGACAQMADVCCAMFARYVEGTWTSPWNVLRTRWAVGDNPIVPPSLGRDLTKGLQVWLEELYDSGDPADKYVR